MLSWLRPSSVQYIYSNGVLVPLATPDFSMPYNVCCMTSTVLAVFLTGALMVLFRKQGSHQVSSHPRKSRCRHVVLAAVVALTAIASTTDAVRRQFWLLVTSQA